MAGGGRESNLKKEYMRELRNRVIDARHRSGCVILGEKGSGGDCRIP